MEIEYETDAGILHVRISGEWTGLHDSRRLIEGYAARAREEGLRRVLLHDRSTGRPMTTGESYQEGDMFSTMAVGLKVAVVAYDPRDTDREELAFAVLVASNRAGRAAMFANAADAIAWLAEDVTPGPGSNAPATRNATP